MTAMYRTSGKLTEPVSNLAAANAYLDEPMEDYVYPDELREVVFIARWRLTNEASWEVTVVTTRPLEPAELATLSSWISGQNADGLGEGFEQQPFAEHGDPDDWYNDEGEIADMVMSSFDWRDNPCTLERVK